MSDIDTMTQSELQEACKDAGLPTYGTKAVLIERLQKSAIASVAENAGDMADWKEDGQEAKQEEAPQGNMNSEIQNNQNKTYSAEEVQQIVAKQVAEATKKLITPSQDEVHKALQSHVGYSDKEVQETLSYVRSRFQGLITVNVDKNQDPPVFQFEGGRQGRMTTTTRQSPKAVMKVAESYANVATAHLGGDFMASMGKIGE